MGDRSIISNYRPISLLCCISKVLERLVFDKSYDFIVKSSISDSQFGFIKNCSTLHQLHTVNFSAHDNRQQVDSIYLDIRKAFDTVSHTKLLAKLWDAGITGSLWNFLKPKLPTDNNVLLLTTVQSGAQSPLGCPRVVYLGPCCLFSILMIYPLCLLFQHLFYLQTIPNVVPKFCHYRTPHVFKMTWTWCTTGVPIAGSHLTPPNAACFDSTIGVYHRLMPPIILANQKFLFLTTVKILVLYFLQTFPGRSIITTFQLRPTNNSD